jgi:opacity protein-like surface antigen
MVRAIAVIVVLLAASAQAAEPVAAKKESEIDAGRYQLFQGTYSTFDLRRSETYSSTSVFLLDTKSGRVKRYVNKIDTEGRYIEEWVPTDRSQERR